MTILQSIRNEIKRLTKAFIYSLQGLRAAFTDQSAFRLEIILLVISIPLALYITTEMITRIILISSVVLVMVVEIINSAIETTINRISCDYHELSGRAKDLGAAAVLLALLNMVAIWICVVGNSL